MIGPANPRGVFRSDPGRAAAGARAGEDGWAAAGERDGPCPHPNRTAPPHFHSRVHC
jgi:hypothetical protein